MSTSSGLNHPGEWITALYRPYYDELRLSTLNEMSVQNPDMFWRIDVGRMGLLFSLNADKLAAFVPKACRKINK